MPAATKNVTRAARINLAVTPEEKRAREFAENGLATLFGDSPAKPMMALPEGMKPIEGQQTPKVTTSDTVQ